MLRFRQAASAGAVVLRPCCMLRRTFGDPHAQPSSRLLQDLENSGLTGVVEPVTKPNLSGRVRRCIDCLGLLCIVQPAPGRQRVRFVGSTFALAAWMRVNAHEKGETGCSSRAVLRVGLGASAFRFQLINIAVLLLGYRRFPGPSL